MIWIILFCVLIWMLASRWRRRHIIKLSTKLKTAFRTYPLVGQLYLTMGSGEDLMKSIQTNGYNAIKFGGLTYFWLANHFVILVADPEVIDVISKKSLEKHYLMSSLLEPLFGSGTLIAPASIWRHRRKAIVPTFRQQNLNQYVNKIFSVQSRIMVKQLHEINTNDTFSMWKYMSAYNFDSVIEAITGSQLNVQSNPDHRFLKAFEKYNKMVSNRAFRPWLHYSAVYKLTPEYKIWKKTIKVIWDFIDPIILSTRTQIETERQDKMRLNRENTAGDTTTYQDRLRPMLEHFLDPSEGQRSLTDLESREEMLVMALAATDTSAVGGSFTAVMLSRHPDIQEKAYKELVEVFGQSDRPPEATDLPRLKYLEAVIKETLRLYPPVPMVVRNIEEDILLPSGLTLVKGIGACLHIWAMHRNPKYWGEDAEEFRPERFLDTPLKHPAAFMPFSFGPRNCPGNRYAMMSMKTLLSTVLREYQLLPATPADGNTTSNSCHSNNEPLRVKFDIMMKDVDDFQVKIKPRCLSPLKGS